MRTPEEIKKGLECCARLKFPNAYCDGCNYLVRPAEHLWECKNQEILTDALTLIEQLEAQAPRWISVEDRLPEEKGDYLVLYSFDKTNSHNFASVMYFIRYDEMPHFDNDGLYGLHVTHWAPLPEPLKEG